MPLNGAPVAILGVGLRYVPVIAAPQNIATEAGSHELLITRASACMGLVRFCQSSLTSRSAPSSS
jgi:hypothetical protein